MKPDVRMIIDSALNASTKDDALALQSMIAAAIGATHWRPVGDNWNNSGQLSGAGGSFDHKIIEDVTNMQDALIERAALRKFGDPAQVPYKTPREAADDLLNEATVADGVVVEFRESDPPTASTKRITAVFRDQGCGMTPEAISSTIFGVGTGHKTDWNWLQGSYGLGGKTTFRNAEAVIVVSRRDPDLLGITEEDRISVAVVQWNPWKKSASAQYLVTSHWEKPGDRAVPFSVPATRYPEFEPGTHVALISYGVEGFHRARRGGDERSFEAIVNTRLFKPVTPVKFRHKFLETDGRDADTFRGLFKRLRDNPRPDRLEGQEVLPYLVGRDVYDLPVSFYVFAKPQEPGERRKFVAKDHVLVFTSNGQVQKHWDSATFRYKTKLPKLADRILVVVETDELPIQVRNTLFTADRQDFVRNEAAVRLEEQVARFLDDWDQLGEINSQLIREAISAGQDSRPTINIAKQISRALSLRGFSIAEPGGTTGGGAGARGGKGPKVPVELLSDPTMLEGPEHVVAEEGETKFVRLTMNAENEFIPRRAKLEVTCTHPDINPAKIAVGPLRAGRLRLSVPVPDEATKGVFQLVTSVAGWTRSSGGLGPELSWTTQFEVVEERRRPAPAPGPVNGTSGKTGEGSLVGIIWKSHDKTDGWDKMTVGEVELVPAEDLARERPEYAELAGLGSRPIPTLILNDTYVGLKAYIDSRARRVSEQTLDQKRDQYAVGVGVGLCMLYKDLEERKAKNEKLPDEEWIEAAKQSVARGVLSMMPAFDELAKEAGLE